MGIKEFRQYLKEMIKKADFKSVREFGRESGINHSYISKILSGDKDKPPSPEILKKMAKVLPTSHANLMDKAGHITLVVEPGSDIRYDTSKKIPILSCITPDQPIFEEENIVGYKRIPSQEIKSGQYFYLKVKGDSMMGDGIYENDLVLVKKQDQIENGRIAVVMIEEGNAVLKKVYQTDKQLILQAENPNCDPVMAKSKDVNIIGKVVSLTREYE
ncbi:MAG: helix-turn-helix domain-containing protein [Halanaerobiales bacterium]|nr:helix-turn-helix domain-containing protein [Halanaerobiales bacterium]